MAERPPVQSVIEALNRNHVAGPAPDHHKTLNDILGVLGPDDDYVYAIGETPSGYLGILLGYAMAKAEGR